MARQCWKTDSSITSFLSIRSSKQLSRTLCSAVLCFTAITVMFSAPLQAQVDPGNGGRVLADGVLHVVPSALSARDTFSLPAPMPQLTAQSYEPKLRSDKETLHGISQRVVFFRDVWEYEFAFTGLRQATISYNGTLSQNVWYMVYRVRNLGTSLSFEDVKKNPEFEHLTKDLQRNKSTVERNFLPRFKLEGWVYGDTSRKYENVSYSDEFSPALASEIQQREDPAVPLFDATELSSALINPVAAEDNLGVWGVAIWTGVHPKVDFVSVFVEGFTNAYRIQRRGDQITIKRKNIQLNFWRPGDTIDESDDEIGFGIPLVDDPNQQVLITRRYNLPGPILTVTEDDPNSTRDLLRAEIDAMFSLQDFTSPLVPILDGGRLPGRIASALNEAGVKVDDGAAVEPQLKGSKWAFQAGGKSFTIALSYQFWEPQDKGIRFIKSLDSFWIYR